MQSGAVITIERFNWVVIVLCSAENGECIVIFNDGLVMPCCDLDQSSVVKEPRDRGSI